jgi:hypothetical protein
MPVSLAGRALHCQSWIHGEVQRSFEPTHSRVAPPAAHLHRQRDTLDYTYELDGDVLTVWAARKSLLAKGVVVLGASPAEYRMDQARRVTDGDEAGSW